MLDVYCIPGMGVDARFFKNLRLSNCNIHHVKWITPEENESLKSYAMRLSVQIDTSRPFALIGVSLGGMCSIEIAKQLKPVKVFVISSCKKSSELSWKVLFWKKLGFYHFLSDEIYIRGALLVKKQFGVRTEEQKQKFLDMLRSAPKNYFRGAVHCLMTWKSEEVPANVIQIHGDADLVLPIKNIKNCDHIIKGGTHFMMVDKANEINVIINKELEPNLSF